MNVRGRTPWVAVALLLALASSALAQEGGKIDPDGLTPDAVRALMPEYFHPAGDGRVRPMDIPDVFGPGAVLTVGNVYMKVTNWGHVGNLFTNVSSDPGGQWPGASATEYLSSIRLAVGAVNPTASDPTAVRRVSYLLEWRPATLEPEDRIYRAYDGIINGARFINDDDDGPDRLGYDGPDYVDEDFFDGRDNDGDGRIDEDFGALGQQMYSLVMRDDTPQAINATFNEKHVPLGLECRQLAWAYSIPGFTDFNVVEYTLINRTNHELDSLYIGWLVDMDAGPIAISNYYADDLDVPFFPQGEFTYAVDPQDTRYQLPHLEAAGFTEEQPLCPSVTYRVNGFSIGDDDGDENRTSGIPSFLLIDHTIDPTGRNGPTRVGFRAFRSFTGGTPYVQGGNPIVDQQRYEFMTGAENSNIDPETGFISADPGDQKGDYIQWCSVGPWLHVQPGQSVKATIAFAVKTGKHADVAKYRTDYQRYLTYLTDPRNPAALSREALLSLYAPLDNALAAQIAHAGVWELRNYYPQPDFHGRETPLIADLGTLGFQATEDCQEERGTDPRIVFVSPNNYFWFDFDCDYCTGVFDVKDRLGGLFHKTWNAEAPPPNPNTNVAAKYNYTDNPDRLVAPEGDRAITLAWDNLSEGTPDPKSRQFDARGYKVWKVANWSRPVGSPGPGEDDWALVGEFRMFRQRSTADGSLLPDNRYFDPDSGRLVCPKVFIPNAKSPYTGADTAMSMPICLELGDLWDRQSGQVIRPAPVPCVQNDAGTGCEVKQGCRLGTDPRDCIPDSITLYPVGRYRYVDREVKNGFLYFYSVTAFDSTGVGPTRAELNGRRTAIEAEGVSPQAGARRGKNVWVVPNPYRGFTRIAERPSSWDLTPNAADPTGTHIDFFGLPPGAWTIRIYTVSGDLVATLKSSDSVNESLRPAITGEDGTSRPGYNRQQDTPDDGQARWNLISRNGQDVVSGIYIFTVESGEGTQRGKFVVIR
jgi:hypothetical protein